MTTRLCWWVSRKIKSKQLTFAGLSLPVKRRRRARRMKRSIWTITSGTLKASGIIMEMLSKICYKHVITRTKRFYSSMKGPKTCRLKLIGLSSSKLNSKLAILLGLVNLRILTKKTLNLSTNKPIFELTYHFLSLYMIHALALIINFYYLFIQII